MIEGHENPQSRTYILFKKGKFTFTFTFTFTFLDVIHLLLTSYSIDI